MKRAPWLCTATSAKEVKEGVNFFPLTVHYREMAFAAGKIPGGFFKRETKPSDIATLVARLIDRPIRPMFPNNFYNEVIAYVFPEFLAPTIRHDKNNGGKSGFDDCGSFLLLI
jgi:polyribonucleotide nucleotidyltransferase